MPDLKRKSLENPCRPLPGLAAKQSGDAALRSILYVSRCKFQAPDRDYEIASLVADSKRRNQDQGITGALIYTGTHFAQIIEGPHENIEALMGKIDADIRHTEILIVRDEYQFRRRFRGWALAYSGPPQFIAAEMEPVSSTMAQKERRAAAERLIALMLAFTSLEVSP